MNKKAFTTRIDQEVLALARRLASTERRSVTSLIEVAVLEYGARRGASSPNEAPTHPITPQDDPVTDEARAKNLRTKKPSGAKRPIDSGRVVRTPTGGSR